MSRSRHSTETPKTVAQRYLRAMVLLQDWRGTADLARLVGCSRGSVSTLIRDLDGLGYEIERRRWSGRWMYRRAPGDGVWERLILPAA